MSESSVGTAQQWKAFFNNWPQRIPRRGIVTNSLNEGMPFKGFMTQGDMLLLERTNPDASGGRFILLTFEVINSVKLTYQLKEADAKAAGFEGAFAK